MPETFDLLEAPVRYCESRAESEMYSPYSWIIDEISKLYGEENLIFNSEGGYPLFGVSMLHDTGFSHAIALRVSLCEHGWTNCETHRDEHTFYDLNEEVKKFGKDKVLNEIVSSFKEVLAENAC